MGSLTSGPSAPSTPSPQIVYVPQTISTSPVTSSLTSTATSGAATTGSVASSDSTATNTDAVINETTEQSLLSRDRSRFGTITTSFRGLLGLGEQAQAAPRKTLLGE